MESNDKKWHYIGKGVAITVGIAGVVTVAIMLQTPVALWGLLLIAIMANQWD